jgi:Tfp pilus assembly protein PilF
MQRTFRPSCLIVLFALLVITAHPLPGAESRWIRLRTAEFEVYSNASPRAARDTLREFEQVRGFFLQRSNKQPSKASPVRLVLFGSDKEFAHYRPVQFAAAYYEQMPDRDYIVMSPNIADAFPMAVHEYVHLLVEHDGLKLPPWLNEGLAEVYSTLRPVGGKILVGDLIPGRFQALRYEKWVPLATILAADEKSPYYNEKNKAGSLYNEGWALTHMLYLSAEYGPKSGQLLRSFAAGEESAAALLKIYGRSVEQIEKDLQGYLRGTTFRGVLVPAKLEKSSGEVPVEPLPDFDAQLVLADLLYSPGKEQAAAQAALERLVQQDPKRSEPYRGLGYIASSQGRREEATQQFGKAYERGDRDPRLLWDYGRLLLSNHGDEAIGVLSALLTQDAERMEVRLELADAQVRAHQAKEALETIRPIRKVTPAEAPRLFRIAAYAYLLNGDPKSAEESAKRALDFAKTDEDRAVAEQLVRAAAAGNRIGDVGPVATETAGPVKNGAVGPVETTDARPQLRRVEPAAESKEALNQEPAADTNAPPRPEPLRHAPPPPERFSASGRFIGLDCRGKQARMTIETAAGKKVFLVDDPTKVAIISGSDGPVDFVCGTQKTPPKVEVGYEKPPANQAVDGVVRTLAF